MEGKVLGWRNGEKRKSKGWDSNPRSSLAVLEPFFGAAFFLRKVLCRRVPNRLATLALKLLEKASAKRRK
ncbi:MAG: hypothetical protein QT01_C0004G0031 [archaeon GW2011_AR6]|nr:MAG: hypothetical protein QT01_C0004G0031 [archaeon GW2011_AR6]